MDSVPTLKRVSPVSFLSWEKDSGERWEPRIHPTDTLGIPPLYLTPHAHSWLSKWNPVVRSMFSIFLWISQRNLQGSSWYWVNTVFPHHLCLLPSSDAEVCKVPSAGQVELLQQTLHGKFGWNSWQQRAPPHTLILQVFNDTKYSSYFWPNQKTFFLLQVSFRNFFKKDFCSGTQKISLRAIFLTKREERKKWKLDNIILSVILQSFTSQINVSTFLVFQRCNYIKSFNVIC